LEQHFPPPDTPHFLFRLAVVEADSWVLADREGFARAFSVPLNKLPLNPDNESNAKRLLLKLARKSGKRIVRDEVVDTSRTDVLIQGSGYNTHLCRFVRADRDACRAAQTSPGLARAIRRLKTWPGTLDV
jgi:hypothetical protein